MSESKDINVDQIVQNFFTPKIGDHASLGMSLRFVIWLLVIGLAILLDQGNGILHFSPLNLHTWALLFIAALARIFVGGIRIAAQWERGVILRLGSFHDIRGPGLIYIIPVIDNVRFLDTRLQTHNIVKQKVITRDNIPTMLDGVLYFLISDPAKAILKVQDYHFAISQFAQGSLRDVVGAATLDDLLSERDKIQAKIRDIIEAHVQEWGLHLDSIRLLDIELPEDLKRMMSRQASAEREKRATITKAEGDMLAAANLSEAAEIMRRNPGAMQLRTLQTIDGLGPSPSNTVILFPTEWISQGGGIASILQGINKTADLSSPISGQVPDKGNKS
ncbi:MAG: SPFH domain-containing protein [Candidatus Riflebacteria bacterium]|nr:SPFH domain-containing protein [Candidatus Riflebacteria bacterium]